MSLTAIIATTLAPIAGNLITAYLKPKIAPIASAVKDIELVAKKLPPREKHNNVLMLIKSTPSIMAFVNKCGWTSTELDTVISFCVLMVKKPLNDDKTKWNDDDYSVTFNFLRIVLSKWLPTLKGNK